MSDLRRRLDRLESEADPASVACPRCRASEGAAGVLIVLVEDLEALPRDPETGRFLEAPVCPSCGRVPAAALPHNFREGYKHP